MILWWSVSQVWAAVSLQLVTPDSFVLITNMLMFRFFSHLSNTQRQRGGACGVWACLQTRFTQTRTYKSRVLLSITHTWPTRKQRERSKHREKDRKTLEMYSRSNSTTLSVQADQQESFAFSRMSAARSTEPEIFTFERIPAAQATAVRSYAPIRPKRRCTRVMYPAKVHMYLPPVEKSHAKRWLVVLCLVVLWQIYTEEPCVETPLGSADSPASDYQVLPFQSVEEQLRKLTEASSGSAGLPASAVIYEDKVTGHDSSSWDQILLNITCPSPSLETELRRAYEQSAGNGYMVALLVYHRLGGDN